MAEYTTSGSTTALASRYDYLPGEYAPLQIETDNSKYSVHTDHLATPKLLTDSSGQVVWRSVRAAFGETTVNDDVDDNGVVVGFNIRFPGQYFDGESGLHYNYFRDYDPGLGRYIQSDPIGLDGGINSYLYVFANPVNETDSYGLSPDSLTQYCSKPQNMGKPPCRGPNLPTQKNKKSKKSKEEKALDKKKNSICKTKDVVTGDKCKDARNRLARLKRCLRLRDEYRRRFGDPGGIHSIEVINTIAAVKRAEIDKDKACEDC